jgi:hypothetical protein
VVRRISVEQYALGRSRFSGRKADVLRYLAHYYNVRQQWLTSGELAMWARRAHGNEAFVSSRSWDKLLLDVRRGLCDLGRAGLVKSQGKVYQRTCRVQGTLCEIFKIVELGR